MKHWIREPLLHFALLGAALFLSYRLLGGIDEAPDEIVITARTIEGLAESFGRAWQRPPTQAELDSLVQEQIKEEVYYREAISAGLDRDDTIIRRRLRQKMEFVTEDLAAQAEPNDAELARFVEQNAERYRRPSRFSLTHVYLSPDRRGDAVERDARTLLARLSKERKPEAGAGDGDPSALPASYDSIAADELDRAFGEDFAKELAALPTGRWSGPVRSAFGVHLVHVTEHTPGGPPELAAVREEATRDWLHERKQRAKDDFYEQLRSGYSVRIETAPRVAVIQSAHDAT